jgi:hypothetical protein
MTTQETTDADIKDQCQFCGKYCKGNTCVDCRVFEHMDKMDEHFDRMTEHFNRVFPSVGHPFRITRPTDVHGETVSTPRPPRPTEYPPEQALRDYLSEEAARPRLVKICDKAGCGYKMPKEARFCPHCGAQVVFDEPVKVTKRDTKSLVFLLSLQIAMLLTVLLLPTPMALKWVTGGLCIVGMVITGMNIGKEVWGNTE